MTAKHFHNSTLNKHGVDVVTDNGERFGIVCPDERTARTLAAGCEAVELLRRAVDALNYQLENGENGLSYPSALVDAEQFLNTLQP